MPPVPFLELARGVREHEDELADALRRVLASGRFIYGPEVESFETEFAAYCGSATAVGVGSGTDAVTLALLALGIGPGDEVIVPAFVPTPPIAAVQAVGAEPVLADVDPLTLTLDPAALAEAFSTRTAAIVPVHLYGRCAAMDAILDFARPHGLAVVEDAAHAHGATLAGRRAGSMGDVGAFSFYPTKNLGSLGDAGAIVTSDESVAQRARALRHYGEVDGSAQYVGGRNSRLDSLQAAVLRVRLRHLDAANERRRALAARYLDGLSKTPLLLPDYADEHAFHLFVVRDRERERTRALLEPHVETQIHYPHAVHEHPAYHQLRKGGPLPISEAAAREVFSLPLYPQLSEVEADRVIRSLSDVVAGRGEAAPRRSAEQAPAR